MHRIYSEDIFPCLTFPNADVSRGSSPNVELTADRIAVLENSHGDRTKRRDHGDVSSETDG